jgi:hypothetical protein
MHLAANGQFVNLPIDELHGGRGPVVAYLNVGLELWAVSGIADGRFVVGVYCAVVNLKLCTGVGE